MTADGHLFELCPYTGMASYVNTPEIIRDFIITGTNDDGIETLALTEDSTGAKFLKVFDYSGKPIALAIPIFFIIFHTNF